MTSSATRSGLTDDPHAIAERLRPLLATEGWLAPEHEQGSEEGYRQHLLHVSDCRRLSVVALVWLPGQSTPIHDHVSWCVVGVYRGEERETHYREVDHGGRRRLVPTGEMVARPGHVEALVPAGAEHPPRDRLRPRQDDLDPRLRRRHRAARDEHPPHLRRPRGAAGAARGRARRTTPWADASGAGRLVATRRCG